MSWFSMMEQPTVLKPGTPEFDQCLDGRLPRNPMNIVLSFEEIYNYNK